MEKVINKISKKAIQTYRQAAETTGNFAHKIRLKAVMADNKSQIDELYEEIGKKVYEKYILKEKIDIDKDFLKECSIISILSDEIEEIRMEILSLRDLKQCKNCHCEIELDFNYCPNCGKNQDEVEYDTENVEEDNKQQNLNQEESKEEQ